ncbi:MAG: deoxyguanosinetriphosphate triphosphohydrolase [Chlamydiae bacterium]|nr:deoxyguanosinetriphosphate triphosphohydrolase [Chlamydiota bacterium]MBI3277429.1 deoxyguanosinetriphosphate triphosphohydrolase [Chlamydiota bacterium]
MTRQEYEAIEEKILAPYARKSGETPGRVYVEEEHPFRTAFQRDRDRIVHSRAFRRLEYKTQVFVNHEGDHYRTRLTHTMEVAQIGRNIARALCLNEDLTEAICLAHDVGHPPFGHSGEKALDVMMKDIGGFEHNQQSLRIVEKLERRYPQFEGLNLTWEVREGIQKHRPGKVANLSSLEAQIADCSDDTAYLCHDVDDGLASELLNEKDLEQVELWTDTFQKVKNDFPNVENEVRCYYTVRNMINSMVTDLVENSEKMIQSVDLKSPDDLSQVNRRLIDFSPLMRKQVQSLREFLFKFLYNHVLVEKMNTRAHEVVCDLFKIYQESPHLLKETTQAKLKVTPPVVSPLGQSANSGPDFGSMTKGAHLYQVVCDYIAGMTDRFALNEHKRLCELEDRI